MRDPARIDPILERLRAAWLAHPDMRLGQLVINAAARIYGQEGADPFYAEDDGIARGLDHLAAHPSLPPRAKETP